MQKYVIEVDNDEALILFEYLSKLDETEGAHMIDEAEQIVLSNLLCLLEEKISEPFSKDYSELVLQAKKRIIFKESET